MILYLLSIIPINRNINLPQRKTLKKMIKLKIEDHCQIRTKKEKTRNNVIMLFYLDPQKKKFLISIFYFNCYHCFDNIAIIHLTALVSLLFKKMALFLWSLIKLNSQYCFLLAESVQYLKKIFLIAFMYVKLETLLNEANSSQMSLIHSFFFKFASNNFNHLAFILTLKCFCCPIWWTNKRITL